MAGADAGMPIRLRFDGRRRCMSRRAPVDGDDLTVAELVLLHDMSFIEQRSRRRGSYLFYFSPRWAWRSR